MGIHELLNGDTIDYGELAPDLADYLERVRVASADPNLNHNDLIDLVYSEENPALVKGVIPGRGYVTREVLASPVYQVMHDLLFRHLYAVRGLPDDHGHDRYTVSVTEAADQLGISSSAIRQAIAGRRLPAVKRNSQWWVSPEGVAAYRVTAKGPTPTARSAGREVGEPLRVVRGAAEGAGLKLWHDGDVRAVDQADGAIEEVVTGWTRAAVFTYFKGQVGARLFELVPGPEENEVTAGPLAVRGAFRIERKTNNAKKASAMFTAFQAVNMKAA